MRRWPKGTYMKLISAERLRAFVGPEPAKKMSGRRLARCAGVHPSFIDHLLTGRRKSCLPRTAQLIAEALEVPLAILFDPELPSAGTTSVQQQKAGVAA